MAKFSKGHYEAIARVMREYAPANFSFRNEYTKAREKRTEDIIHDLIRVFKKDNPLFDEDRFLIACGLQEKG